MRSAILNFWAFVFARPAFVRLNRLLYLAGLRGLGILNYRSMAESGERRFLEVLFKSYADSALPRVVLDVGANVGKYTDEVLRVTPDATVYCFEPHPLNVAKLRQNLVGRATVVASAVGATAGTLELFDYADEDGSSHASVYREVFDRIHRRPCASHQVDVITLDEFVERTGLRHIVLLKIDTEGHELAALAGATRTLREGKVDVVHFEFNEMNIASRTFLGDFFQALPDYRFYRLLRSGWTPVLEAPLENIFAFQNIVAVRNGSRAQGAFA